MLYTINAPKYFISDGEEHVLRQTADQRWDDGFLAVADTTTPVLPEVIKLQRKWKNHSAHELHVQLCTQVQAHFTATHYVIPCVNYDGNEWGNGGEPKGLTYNGKPWIFAGNRSGIPACTISENEQIALALFAGGEQSSLQVSCSLLKNANGSMCHSLYYPIIEKPLAYTDRDKFSKAIENTICIATGESFITTAYLWLGEPMWHKYGIANVQNIAMEIFKPTIAPRIPQSEVWRLGIAYAKCLAMDFQSHKLFSIGRNMDGKSEGKYLPSFEIGWCGQNALFARMLLKNYTLHGDEDSLRLALQVLDTWANAAMIENGLMYVHFEKKYTDEPIVADTCNLGYAISEMTKCAQVLEILKQPLAADCLQAAKQLGEFFCTHYSPEYGFGKTWDAKTGQVLEKSGTIGVYIAMGLMDLFSYTKEERYLRVCEQALDFYCTRDIDHCVATAGALDTTCTDKETSGAVIMAALMAYECTQNPKRLEQALKAAYYFCSWMYYVDLKYPYSEFEEYGYRVVGGTAVSAQHHHIDGWGGLMVPWLLKLAKYTQDDRWRERALMMWGNVTQCIAMEGQEVFHGRRRPLGSQNEAFYQCQWHLPNPPMGAGQFNDWLVAWPGSYRLYTLDMVSDWQELGTC